MVWFTISSLESAWRGLAAALFFTLVLTAGQVSAQLACPAADAVPARACALTGTTQGAIQVAMPSSALDLAARPDPTDTAARGRPGDGLGGKLPAGRFQQYAACRIGCKNRCARRYRCRRASNPAACYRARSRCFRACGC